MKKVREKLNAKLRKSGGFTLVEMLIVVAIIAILIAISIPLVGSSLEKARDATDEANERAAKAAAVIKYLGVEDGNLTNPGATGNIGTFNYDAKDGKLVDSATKPEAYGRCTGDTSCYTPAGETGTSSNVDKFIQVEIKSDGTVEMSWTN